MENIQAISAAKRKSLPGDKFAIPSLRKYPIDTAARTRNAAARLEQNKDRLTPAQYAEAKRNIASAAKRFGIKSEYAKKPSARKGLRMRIAADGSIDVHHALSDGGVLMPGLVELSDSDGPVWVQVAKTGTFNGYRDGAFSITNDTLNEIVRNFKATENKRIPIDFEHASEADPTSGEIPTKGAPAQGWIVDLDNRGGELWALVEWQPLARDYIKSGQYKFFSPAIRFNSRDRVTNAPIGARMTSGALTNNPFLDGMAPLAARDFDANPLTQSEIDSGTYALSWLSDMGGSWDLPAIRSALRCDDFASCEDMLARCGRLREIYTSEDWQSFPGIDEVTAGIRNVARVPLHVDVMQALEGIEDLLESLIPSDEYEEGEQDGVTTTGCLSTDAPTGVAPIAAKDNQPTALTAEQARKEPQTMSTISLSDHEARVAEAVTNATAEFELTIKNKDAKLEEANQRIAELENQLASLKDAETKRAGEAKAKRVALAFDQHKDSQKLTEKHRQSMVVLMDANPELFEELYPVLDSRATVLSARISAERPAQALPAGVERPSIKQLADKHLKEGKTFDEAWSAAINELTPGK